MFSWARKYGLRVNLDLHTWYHHSFPPVNNFLIAASSKQPRFTEQCVTQSKAEVSTFTLMIAAFNHSGRSRVINFLHGAMGIANAQRVLNYIRIITEFISQPEYNDLVPVFSVLNEPLLAMITKPILGHLSVNRNTRQLHLFIDLLSPLVTSRHIE
jgi:glucan 1,3-beta-glucosidase